MLFDQGKMKIHAGNGKISVLNIFQTGRKMKGVTGKTWGIQQIKSEFNNLVNEERVAWGVYRKVPKRPPAVARDFVAQGLGGLAGFFAGAIAGATIGGVLDGTFSPITRPGQWGFGGDESGVIMGLLGGAAIGPGIGVWLGGRTRTIKANIGLTILGSVLGAAVGWTAGIISIGILSPLVVAGPIAGSMLMFNLSRKWAAPPEGSSTSSLRLQGAPVTSFTLVNLRF